MKFVSFLCVTFFLFDYVHGESVKIAIHHWNDIGAQLEQYLPLTDMSTEIPLPCPMSVNTSAQCLGGHGKLVHAAHANLNSVEHHNVLRMTSGNLVGGESGWLSSVGWKKFGSLVNTTYNLTAMSLGMKEFGAGLKRTNEYLEAAEIRPVLTNVVCSSSTISPNDTEYTFCSYIKSSAKVTVHSSSGQGVEIGVLGFINRNVEKLGSPGKLQFTNIVIALKEEVNKLKNEGIRFFVALGDGSLTTAQNIIDEIPEIKVVIYGMGYSSSKDMTGEYPSKYKNSYIGTARIYGGSVGTMVIQFDSTSGNIENVDGSKLVKLDNDYPEANTEALHMVNKFREENVTEDANNKVGQTLVKLHGGKLCWENECNLGNLMADAALHCVYSQNVTQIPFELFPVGNVAAVWHGGALYYDKILRMEHITKLDIHRWLPYHNMVDLVSLNGSSLRALFELSASALDEDDKRHPKWGQFLQVSNGLQVTYSTSGGVGKVDSIRMVHNENSIPTMDDIKPDLLYLLVVPSYIHEGRSIFSSMKNLFEDILQAKEGYYQIDFDDDCLENYIRAMNKISTGFEERIYIDVESPSSNPKCKNNKAKHVLLTLLVTFIILAIVFVGWKFVWPRFRDRNSYPANQN